MKRNQGEISAHSAKLFVDILQCGRTFVQLADIDLCAGIWHGSQNIIKGLSKARASVWSRKEYDSICLRHDMTIMIIRFADNICLSSTAWSAGYCNIPRRELQNLFDDKATH